MADCWGGEIGGMNMRDRHYQVTSMFINNREQILHRLLDE